MNTTITITQDNLDVYGSADFELFGATLQGTFKQYLRAGLLDEIRLSVVPVLLGGGVRLFDNLGDGRIDLEGTRVVESDDVTHLWYRIRRHAAEGSRPD